MKTISPHTADDIFAHLETALERFTPVLAILEGADNCDAPIPRAPIRHAFEEAVSLSTLDLQSVRSYLYPSHSKGTECSQTS